MVSGLKSGSLDSNSIDPIRIFNKKGNAYSLDNRSLYAFKEANRCVSVKSAKTFDISRESWKRTTKDDGLTTRVRGER